MLMAEDVLLLLTDDTTGRSLVDGTRRDIAVAGAVIAELAAAGRLEAVTADGVLRRTTLQVVPGPAVGDDVLDEALARVGAGNGSPAAVLDRIRKGLRERLYARLVERGVLRAQEGRVLGIFPTSSWPAVDGLHEAEVRHGLHEVLVAGRAPTPHEASVVALLSAVDALPKVLPGTGLPNRELRARGKRVAEGDVGGEAARKAWEAVQAAVVAAGTATAVAAASS